MGCSGGSDGDSTGEFVIFLIGSLPDWKLPTPASRKVIPGDMVPVLQEARASGQSLRELAERIGVSHETVRAAMKS